MALSDQDSGLLSMLDGATGGPVVNSGGESQGDDALGSLIASLAATRSPSNSSDENSNSAWPPPPSDLQVSIVI